MPFAMYPGDYRTTEHPNYPTLLSRIVENLSRLMRSRGARTLSAMSIAFALLVWALRDMSPAAVWSAVEKAEYAWLGLGLITFLASYSVRAQRWGTLLRAHCDPGSFGIRHSAVFVGFAGNNLLPAHAGELVRATLLHRLGGVPFGAALGSIVAERMLDMIIVLLFLLAPFLGEIVSETAGGTLGALHLGSAVSAIAVLCLALFVAASWPQSIAVLAGRGAKVVGLSAFTPRIEAGVRGLLSGLAAFRNPIRTLIALLETVCIWCLTAITYWSGMVSFGISSPGATGALFVQSVAALGFAIPSSPGSFGPFEAATRFALAQYYIPTDTIVAYTLTLHFLMYSSVTAIGLGFVSRLGLSWGDLFQGPHASHEMPSGHVAVLRGSLRNVAKSDYGL
jgi:uncharacterized protein (TIRG00374 family)